jgi:uncharacterized DUF497 family protein
VLFDWDKNKAASNFVKHKVYFEEAATVFGDPLSDTFDDPDHSADEHRFLIVGYSETNRLLFVSHTDDGITIRIISAREPARGEQEQYDKDKTNIADDEMRPEYDLSELKGKVRGKYVERYQTGTNMVLLESDVQEAFPDSGAVNEALRMLIKVARQQVQVNEKV